MARDLVVSVVGGIVATALLAVVALLWNGMFAPLWNASPLAFTLLCLALLVAGLAAGFAIGWGVNGRRVDAEAAKAAAVERERQRGETERERMRREWEEANGKREKEARELAKAKAIVDAEARELAALDQFTDAQLLLMLKVLDADSPGFRTTSHTNDDIVATQLLESQVVRFSEEGRIGSVWILVPNWRAWVVRHREDIEKRLRANG